MGARLGTLNTLFPTGRVSSTDGKEVSTPDAWNRYGGNGHPHYYTCGWQSHAHGNTASGLELPPLWDDAALTSHAEPKGGKGLGRGTEIGCTNLGPSLLNRRPSREANASLADATVLDPTSINYVEGWWGPPKPCCLLDRKHALRLHCRGQR